MISENVPLKPYCRYRIGGPARALLPVRTIGELVDGLREWRARADTGRVFVMGAGCNLLVDDHGYDGLIVRSAISFVERQPGHRVRVGAGTAMEELVASCAHHGLSGFEWAGGLPGSVGGAIVGNAGAFGGETKDRTLCVESIDLATLETRTRPGPECGFAYRESVFKQRTGAEYIVAATFQLVPGDPDAIARSAQEKVAYRAARHPLDHPNVGSIFKNVDVPRLPAEVAERFADRVKVDPVPVLPAAVLLAEAGLKGQRIGGIEISPKHPNFFVNVDRGRACDVRRLIRLAQEVVRNEFGVELEPEIVEVR